MVQKRNYRISNGTIQKENRCHIGILAVTYLKKGGRDKKAPLQKGALS